MSLSRRTFLAQSAFALAGLTLAGCSSQGGAGEAEAGAQSAADAAAGFPVTLEHAFGSTTIEAAPERIATIGWGNHDVVLALGKAPVGMDRATYGIAEGENTYSWTQEAIDALGATSDVVFFDGNDGIDLEAVNDVEPDVMLCPYSGVTEDDYDNLSEICPTVPYSTLPWTTPWREQTEVIAKAMGLDAEGAALIEQTETLIAEKAAAHGVSGQKVAVLWLDASDLSTITAYKPGEPRVSYLEDLGFTHPTSLAQLGADSENFYFSFSAEEADKLDDIDVVITYGDDAFVTQLQGDAILGTIPAIKAGRVVPIDLMSALSASCTPSVLSIPATIDEYLGLIEDALAK